MRYCILCLLLSMCRTVRFFRSEAPLLVFRCCFLFSFLCKQVHHCRSDASPCTFVRLHVLVMFKIFMQKTFDVCKD